MRRKEVLELKCDPPNSLNVLLSKFCRNFNKLSITSWIESKMSIRSETQNIKNLHLYLSTGFLRYM